MNYTKKFERELLQERKYKEVCRENHELIENKYIEIFGKENYDSLIQNDSNNPEKVNIRKFIEYFFQGKNRDVLKYLRSIYDNINKCI